MKKTAFTTVMSILLIIVCLFGLVAVGLGVKDGLAIKKYKEDDAKAADVVGQLEDAIALLKENEDAYNEGVGTYAKGLSDYSAGKKELAAGKKTYNAGKSEYEKGLAAYKEGKKALEEGYAQYEQGKKDLEAGKKKVAEGQKLIDANTEAYNKGKAMLEKIEPLMPLLNTYVKFRDGSIAKLPGFDSAQAWFVSKVRPIAEKAGLTIPEDVTDFPKYMQQMVADGKAQLKEYEDGLAALEAGKKQVAEGEAKLKAAEAQLAAGEKELAAGEKKLKAAEKELAAGANKLKAGEKELAAGAAKLADGKASLEEFENGMALVDEYTMTCYKNKPIYRHNGDMAVPGPEQRLGEDFSWYKMGDDGKVVTLRNGDPYLDLDQCLVVCKTFRESVADHVADVTHELYMRLGLYVAVAIASLLGLIAGFMGLAGKGGAATLGIITAVLAVACNIFGACTRYYGYTYPLKDGTYSGTLQFVALILLAVVAVIFAVAAASAKKKAKAEAVPAA